MGWIKVYKDRANGTWYWACDVPMCINTAWEVGGQQTAVRSGLRHLRTHQRVGFGRPPR